MTTLVLWDVDGTLLSAGPAGRAAFDAAIHAVVGSAPGDHGVQMSGKTDPQIALEIMGGLLSDAIAQRHLPAVLSALEREVAGAVDRVRAEGRMMPGIPRILERLARQPGVLQSVLTGNLAATARLKLGAFGLDRWLDLEVGAYGSDHHDRTELVPIAIRNLRELRGVTVAAEDVWVVGDTPNDLACARAGGARCLLVATGHVPPANLAGLEADAFLPDLADVDEVVRILVR